MVYVGHVAQPFNNAKQLVVLRLSSSHLIRNNFPCHFLFFVFYYYYCYYYYYYYYYYIGSNGDVNNHIAEHHLKTKHQIDWNWIMY